MFLIKRFKEKIEFKFLSLLILSSIIFLSISAVYVYKESINYLESKAKEDLIWHNHHMKHEIHDIIIRKENIGKILNKKLRERLNKEQVELNDIKVSKEDGESLKIYNDKSQTGFLVPKNSKITNKILKFMKISENFHHEVSFFVKLSFLNIWYIENEGTSRVTPSKDWLENVSEDHDPRKDPYYYLADKTHNPDKKPVWTPIYYDKNVKSWMTSLIIPDYVGQSLEGVSGNDYNLKLLFKEFLKVTANEKGIISFLLDSKGNILAHPQYTDIIDKNWEKNISMLNAKNLKDKSIKNFFDKYIKNTFNKNQEIAMKINNKDSFLIANSIDFLDWHIISYKTYETITDKIDDLFFRVWFIAIFFILLLSLFLYLGVKKLILSRLFKLKNFIDFFKIDKMNLKDINIENNDEIGKLTKSFVKLSEDLNEMFSFEKIVSEISMDFNNVTVETINKKINKSLKRIGEFRDVDRAYLFIYDDHMMMNNINRWAKNQTHTEHEFSMDFSSEEIQWFSNQIKEKKRVTVYDISLLRDDAERFKTYLKSTNNSQEDIKSIIGYPIFLENKLFGFLGFDTITKKRNWNEIDSKILEIVGKIFRDAIYNIKSSKNLKRVKNYLDSIINSMPSILIGIDENMDITHWNQEAQRITGIKKEAAIGKCIMSTLPEFKDKKNLLEKILKNQEAYTYDKVSSNKNTKVYQSTTIFPLVKSEVNGVVIRIDDKTEEHDLKEQLNQHHKMDAIGQLAGGVAHDFNNLLSAIISSAQLISLLEDKNNEEDLDNYINIIMKASTRAADLTSKLLSFGRKGKGVFTIIDISNIIDDVTSILSRTLDKKVKIKVNQEAENLMVYGENTSLQNTIINLCINSAQAMLNDGTIEISIENIFLDKSFCKQSTFDISEGEYIKISVKDEGRGISPENIEKIFEPFFTTKKLGEGTGLGLSTVYGIIQDHKGTIEVKSKINEGTSFNIFLPSSKEHKANNNNSNNNENKLIRGKGLILLVDDEEILIATGKAILKKMGYTVMTAKNGEEAVKLFEKSYKDINLVIMDMMMPKMNGYEAFYKMRDIDPNSKIIISSGFFKTSDLDDLKKSNLNGFIQKPFKSFELSKLLNDLIT